MELKDFSGKRICVAISGGVDSVSLLHYLKGLEAECGFTLCAVHCEHGIRGEDSKADCAFVKDLAEERGLPFAAFSRKFENIILFLSFFPF